MNYRIGVDIGGTSVKLGVVDSDFNVVEKIRFMTGDTADDIISNIISSCKTLIEKYQVVAVGIGCPGDIEYPDGIVTKAGNLPFRNTPLVKTVSDALGLPTYVENHGSCALIGEHAAGACKGVQNTVIITIGTGIGGATIINDLLVRGCKGGAGELGHFVIDRNGEQCTCGLKGCFEQYASATALIEQTAAAAEANPDSILAHLAKDGIDGKTPFNAAEKGCPVAKTLLAEYGHILSDGINSLVHIFQPETVVISGGIANQGEPLLSLIRPHLLYDTRVVATTLQGNGGIIGAALLGTDYAR